MSDDKHRTAARQSLERYLAAQGKRNTFERRAILDVVAVTPGHFTIAAFGDLMHKRGISVAPATIYNTFKLLCDAGLLRRHCINDKTILYERATIPDALRSHIHLVCLECDEVRDINEPPTNLFMQESRLPYRFSAHYSEYYIYGICARCQRRAGKKVSRTTEKRRK